MGRGAPWGLQDVVCLSCSSAGRWGPVGVRGRVGIQLCPLGWGRHCDFSCVTFWECGQ